MLRNSIGLSGVQNARELGGYRSEDGRVVKGGVLLRTARLSTGTEEDLKRLKEVYHLAKIIDLRSDEEIYGSEEIALFTGSKDPDPDPEIEGAEYINLQILDLKKMMVNNTELMKEIEPPLDFIQMLNITIKAGFINDELYFGFLDEEPGRSSYSRFMRELMSLEEGKAVLSTCICCRDDIMGYLIGKGMDKSLSFKTMESVRKGKGLAPNMEEAMIEAGVPDWYIDSCKKIKYMFPRAHAAAYVMMALRIAYCKVYYPLAYYAAYYSIRAKAFDYELMAQGQQHLLDVMADYSARKDTLSPAEQAQLDDMLVVREMYARGIEFLPIRLEQAKARAFSIVDGKLMPSFNSIAGMGDKAADQLEEAVKKGPFVSREDVRDRAKISNTIIDKMGELGILGNLPQSNQFSLFDFMNA